MLDIYTAHNITEAAVTSILTLFRLVMGSLDTNLPKTFLQLKSTVSDLVVEHHTYYCCPKGHRLFEGETCCPTCRSHRDACTRFYYIPLIPRLQQLYEIPTLARLLQSHTSTRHGCIDDLHQSTRWTRTYEHPDGLFYEDNRALMLTVSSDGFQPFHHSTKDGSYSIWAFHSSISNLPPQLRETLLIVNGLTEGNINFIN